LFGEEPKRGGPVEFGEEPKRYSKYLFLFHFFFLLNIFVLDFELFGWKFVDLGFFLGLFG
jgi:hypothetical protein